MTPVRLEPAALRSRVKHSTTEPLGSRFCQILMIFLPKCRPFYVVLEKGHGAGKKGMALEKRGMARRHA